MSDAGDTVLAMLAQRGAGKTICPSEAARALAGAGGDWRARMPEVHAAVDRLAAQRAVRLTWQGRAMTTRDGPYRIGHHSPEG